MTGSLTFSVAMATYEGTRYLAEQLESIRTQTRPPHELVVCDDGSGDGTPDIVRRFETEASFPVRLIEHDGNRGTCAAFETAIEGCTGDLIALADQDDVWHPEKLETLENAFEADAKVGLVFSDAALVNDALAPLGSTLWEALRISPRELRQIAADDAFSVLLRRNLVTGATMAYRRELNDLVLPIRADLAHDWWIAILASAVTRIGLVDECLVDYRQHGRQQLGEEKRSLLGELHLARTQGRAYFEAIERFFSAALVRLESRADEVPQERRNRLAQRVAHTQARARMRRQGGGRWRLTVRELVAGRYARYSLGWKALAQDLFLSGPDA